MCQYANYFKAYAVANWHIDKLINYFLCIYNMICFQSNAVPQASARKRYIRPLQANILAIFPSYTTFVRFKIQYDGRKEKIKH